MLEAGKETTSCIRNIMSSYFGVNVHRDIILAGNSHPFLSQTISCDGRQCSACHYLNLTVNWGFVHLSSVYCCTIRFLLTLFK